MILNYDFIIIFFQLFVSKTYLLVRLYFTWIQRFLCDILLCCDLWNIIKKGLSVMQKFVQKIIEITINVRLSNRNFKLNLVLLSEVLFSVVYFGKNFFIYIHFYAYWNYKVRKCLLKRILRCPLVFFSKTQRLSLVVFNQV